MLKRIVLTACVLALVTGPILADHHENAPPPDAPQIVLMPPPGTEKPADPGTPPPQDPEEAKNWLLAMFFPKMDADGDGALSEEEVRAWISWVHIPMPPEGAPMGDGGGEGGEVWPGGECGDAVGNEVSRSVSMSPGPTNQAISLPAGREAGCFHLAVAGADIETTPNEFQIVDDSDGSVVWHSMDDGQAAFEALVLSEGIYQIQMISCDVPTAVFTITYIDYPVGP